ncbi:hypothetical protein [Paenibacillus radicis (ex Gao et al. 2016)]|uniref:Uncharacterized protein n=1 Tax=Paenibacillus radicis (ex Gao et al. 2016) TaxID=1737354 RepID=A0A917HP23_9BACL|nr:hypothetical protein [Paenibacillus radicis (ex Gao et al. 2016)]GGG86173.1 hypothetical protein GCM10010918_50420 [Paenibacillus radicis (ex Gao et al. 2016)]
MRLKSILIIVLSIISGVASYYLLLMLIFQFPSSGVWIETGNMAESIFSGILLVAISASYVWLLMKLRKQKVILCFISIVLFILAFFSPIIISQIIQGQKDYTEERIESEKEERYINGLSVSFKSSNLPFELNVEKSILGTSEVNGTYVLYFQLADTESLSKVNLIKLFNWLPDTGSRSYYIVLTKGSEELVKYRLTSEGLVETCYDIKIGLCSKYGIEGEES